MKTIILLFIANIFMTIAWYGHLNTLRHRPFISIMKKPIGMDYFYASICPALAVYFIFRGGLPS